MDACAIRGPLKLEGHVFHLAYVFIGRSPRISEGLLGENIVDPSTRSLPPEITSFSPCLSSTSLLVYLPLRCKDDFWDGGSVRLGIFDQHFLIFVVMGHCET